MPSPGPGGRWRALAGRALMVGCLGLGAACAAPAPPPQPPSWLVQSNYQRVTGDAVRRDCGYSTPLPGKPGWSIWLFCDTVVTSADGNAVERLILGTDTAAEGPYQAGRAPGWLTEVPTPPTPTTRPPHRLALSPGTAPQPFLPAPDGLELPGGLLPCAGPGSYPAAWISGVVRASSSGAAGQLLIAYDDYCVNGSADAPTAEGFGLVSYDPAGNALGPVTLVFRSGFGLPLSPQQVLGSPIVGADGYLYLFGFCQAAPPPAGCGAGQVFLARTVATPASWGNPFGYQYWTGDGWAAQPAAAGSLLPAAHPLGVSVGDYAADGHGLVMIEQTSLNGGFQAWQARSPAGPWRRLLAGRVPCTRGTEPGTDGLCRALIGHPELSTRSDLLISYYNPGNGHVGVAAYPW
jgi:hypothetical protein